MGSRKEEKEKKEEEGEEGVVVALRPTLATESKSRLSSPKVRRFDYFKELHWLKEAARRVGVAVVVVVPLVVFFCKILKNNMHVLINHTSLRFWENNYFIYDVNGLRTLPWKSKGHEVAIPLFFFGIASHSFVA